MTKLYKTALLAALGLATLSAAQASTSDMLLGFNDAAGPSSAQNDYVIDLGAVSQFTTTASLDLSSYFNATTFATAFSTDAGYLNNVSAGVVEAYGGGYPKTLFLTSAGTPSSTIQKSPFLNSIAILGAVTVGEYTSASGITGNNGWSYAVAVSPTDVGASSSASAQAGVNPLQNLNNGIITETLYTTYNTGAFGSAANPVAWSAVGTFNINVNNGSILFTGVSAVPEPSTYVLALVGGGLMLVALRRRSVKSNS